MRLRSKGYLWDMAQAVQALQEYTKGKSLSDYLSDKMLRDAVEREFQILGEALLRLKRSDPETAGKIGHTEEIIGFRNILVHEYDRILPEQVWRTVRQDLPNLQGELEALQEAIEDPPS